MATNENKVCQELTREIKNLIVTSNRLQRVLEALNQNLVVMAREKNNNSSSDTENEGQNI
jgi:hypothetical protein